MINVFNVCSMLLVRGLLGQIPLANEPLFLSDADWFAVQEITECSKPVYDPTIAIQLKKLTAGKFFGETAVQKGEQRFFLSVGYVSCHKFLISHYEPILSPN